MVKSARAPEEREEEEVERAKEQNNGKELGRFSPSTGGASGSGERGHRPDTKLSLSSGRQEGQT